MKPAAFDYVRAETLSEALEALHGDAENTRIIAGGMSLVPMLNMRLATPATLVDITRIEELRQIEDTGSEIRVGAAVRQAELEHWPGLSAAVPLLAKVFPWIGHMQTRSRGTVCGSIAHSDPSAELPLSLLALDGSLTLRRRRKTRKVKARDFFLGMMSTDVAPEEMITAAHFPKATPGAGYAFAEVARRHGDFAITACAAVAHPDGAVRLVVGGVADTARVLEVPAGAGDLGDRLNEFAWALRARDDLHATARYRRDLVRKLGQKTIEEALSCRV